MRVLTEKKVDAKVVAWFKRAYPTGVCIKLAVVGAHGTAGWPDRMFLYNGRVCFVEFKAPGKGLTPLQAERLDQLREAGHKAEWFGNPDTAIQWIRSVMED